MCDGGCVCDRKSKSVDLRIEFTHHRGSEIIAAVNTEIVIVSAFAVAALNRIRPRRGRANLLREVGIVKTPKWEITIQPQFIN